MKLETYEHYLKGKELFENLTGDDADLIKFYVNNELQIIENLRKQIEDMINVFSGIRKYVLR